MRRAVFLALLLAASSSAADERLDRLPQTYRDWLEKEVPYIITRVEREAFLDQESEAEWGAFVDAFWRRRDPDPVTPLNEFKEEHYRRLDFANRALGREASVPGWMTDRGKIYIILGEPREREEFTSVPFIYPAELWFYDQNREKGLPPLYLLFWQEHHAGPYRLFNHFLDDPEDLLPIQPYETGDSRREAYTVLSEINPALAHASITMRADRGAAVGIAQPESAGLDFQTLLSDIYASPFRRVDTRYVDAAKSAKGLVETDYLFNYVPNEGMANVLPGPGGTSFVHFTIEIEPRHMTIAHDPDGNAYYTRFEVRGEVTTRDDDKAVWSFTKEPFVQLTESQVRDVGNRAFAYRDMFPLVPGAFWLRVVLKNQARNEYTIFETALDVAARADSTPFLGAPVPLYGMGRLPQGGEREPEPYRTYQIGSVALDPNAKRTVAIGNYLMAHVPLENVPADYSLSLKAVSVDDPAAPPVLQESLRLDSSERPLVVRSALGNAPGGRYRLDVDLLDAEGRPVSSTSTPFAISPLLEIARPWTVRESIFGEELGPVLLALAEQRIRLGDLAEGRGLAERSLESDPNVVGARLVLARFHLDEKNPAEAVRLLEPARAQQPKNVEVLLALGDAHFELQNWSRTAELLETALTLRRPDTHLLNALGVCHAKLGDSDKAKSYLKRSLEMDPSQESVQSLLLQLESKP